MDFGIRAVHYFFQKVNAIFQKVNAKLSLGALPSKNLGFCQWNGFVS